jgi:hypothetical protein
VIDPALFTLERFVSDVSQYLAAPITARISDPNGRGTAVVSSRVPVYGSGVCVCDFNTFREEVTSRDSANAHRFRYVTSELISSACIRMADVPLAFRGKMRDTCLYGRLLDTPGYGATTGRHGVFYYRADAPHIVLRDIGDWPSTDRMYGVRYSAERVDMVLRGLRTESTPVDRTAWLPLQFNRVGDCQLRPTRKSDSSFVPMILPNHASARRIDWDFHEPHDQYAYSDKPMILISDAVLEEPSTSNSQGGSQPMNTVGSTSSQSDSSDGIRIDTTSQNVNDHSAEQATDIRALDDVPLVEAETPNDATFTLPDLSVTP